MSVISGGKSAAAQSEEIVIVSQPLAGLQASGSTATQVFTQEALDALPYDRLDAALSAQSSFSLFRRIPSISANPTIQGATLRGIGPNGAGRAVVLLDGAPLNDPFGNWVNWSAVNVGSVSQVLLERGGRPLTGGIGALSGLIAIETGAQQAGQRLSFSGNTLEGFDSALTHAGTIGKANIIASANGGFRGGYILLPESQRGLADIPTRSHNAAVNFKVSAPVSDGPLNERWTAALQVRGFTEGRDNGLDGAVNSTDGFDGALRLNKPATLGSWGADFLVYGQIRQFENLFTATDEARETTRQVLDQFSVPAYGAGLRGQVERQWNDKRQSVFFAQLDHKSGETREAYRNLGAGFTRERRAGGQQLLYGLGVLHSEHVNKQLSLELGLRVDGTRLSGGSRIESDSVSGHVLRDDVFEARADITPGGEIGLVWTPAPAWRLFARGYTASRLPSLNELFRPFRVGNDITEANPDLQSETLRGIDAGGRFEPVSGQFIDATLFYNWVRNAVGNLSIPGETGGVIDPCGFVPTGGSCRQRGNIDHARVLGAELQVGLRLSKTVGLSSFYGYTDAKVRADDAAPGLAGKRLAQVPRHQGNMTLHWTPADLPLAASISARAQSKQFEDDLNSRALSGFGAIDMSARWTFSDGATLRLDIINLTDTQIEAGESAAGLITRSQPFTASVGVDLRF